MSPTALCNVSEVRRAAKAVLGGAGLWRIMAFSASTSACHGVVIIAPLSRSLTRSRKSKSVITRFGVGAKIFQFCSNTGLTYSRTRCGHTASFIGLLGLAHKATLDV